MLRVFAHPVVQVSSSKIAHSIVAITQRVVTPLKLAGSVILDTCSDARELMVSFGVARILVGRVVLPPVTYSRLINGFRG